jgi:hypothetical protein
MEFAFILFAVCVVALFWGDKAKEAGERFGYWLASKYRGR